MVEIWGLHSVAWQAGTGSRLERLNASSMGSLFLARPTRVRVLSTSDDHFPLMAIFLPDTRLGRARPWIW